MGPKQIPHLLQSLLASTTLGAITAFEGVQLELLAIGLKVQHLVCDDDLAARGLASAIAGCRGAGEALLPSPHLWSPLRGSDAHLKTSPLLQQQLAAALLQFCSQAMKKQGDGSGDDPAPLL